MNERAVDVEENYPRNFWHNSNRLSLNRKDRTMTRRTLGFGLALSLIVISAGALAVSARQGMTAKATIAGEGIKGTVELREVNAQTAGGHDMAHMTGTKAVEITVNVTGLKPGAHGMHLHAVGKCEAPGFTTAGGHFDPGPAGNMDPDMNHPFHMGDLPNLVADAKGNATLKAVTNRVTLGAGPLSVFDTDGTAIIIHGNPDQGTTGEAKSGLSGGPRVACGVIGK
jgi:Cu-Zn family superoxide dismutase